MLSQWAASRFPNEIALVDEFGALSFAELHKNAEQLAAFLHHSESVQVGQKVAILFSNHRGFILSLLSVTRLGADVVPINPRIAPAQVEQLLSTQNPSLVLLEPGLESKVDNSWPSRVWSEELGLERHLPLTKVPGRLVVLTSGSTGVSKGIKRRPKIAEVLPVTWGLLNELPLELNRPMFLAIPFFHGYGIATIALSLFLGAPIFTARRYDIPSLLSIHKQEVASGALLITVPTLLWRWEAELGFSHFAAIITGSAPLESALCRRVLQKCGPVLYNLYGSTETGLISLATPTMLDEAPGCVGLPLPGTSLSLEGEGDVGTIKVKSPLVLKPDSQGWRDTGDLGRFDQNGYLHVCGRADTMIVSGGENVYPHELSDVLREHPQVDEVAVLPVDDPEFGQRLVAVIGTRHEVTEAQLRDWLGERLERFKHPKRIHLVSELPRNELGKVDRKAVRAKLDRLSSL